MRKFWFLNLVGILALTATSAHAERPFHGTFDGYRTGRPLVLSPYYTSMPMLSLGRPAPTQAQMPKSNFHYVAAETAQQNYDVVEGSISTTQGFEDKEIWVDGVRIFSGPDAIVIFEDNSRAKYNDVQAVLKRNTTGPRRVRVYKFPGGNAFAYVQLLP